MDQDRRTGHKKDQQNIVEVHKKYPAAGRKEKVVVRDSLGVNAHRIHKHHESAHVEGLEEMNEETRGSQLKRVLGLI